MVIQIKFSSATVSGSSHRHAVTDTFTLTLQITTGLTKQYKTKWTKYTILLKQDTHKIIKFKMINIKHMRS